MPTTHDHAVPSNGEFVKVLDAYRGLGGLARAQEVASMTVSRCGPNVRTLALSILNGQLLSFEWQSQIWIPLFQFDRATMSLHQGLVEVLALLAQTFTPWEQAIWFAQPNDALGDRPPAQMLTLDCTAVAFAAQTDQHAFG